MVFLKILGTLQIAIEGELMLSTVNNKVLARVQEWLSRQECLVGKSAPQLQVGWHRVQNTIVVTKQIHCWLLAKPLVAVMTVPLEWNGILEYLLFFVAKPKSSS